MGAARYAAGSRYFRPACFLPSNVRTNKVPGLVIIASGEQVHIYAIETEQAASKHLMPEWFGQLHKWRSTMTKSLILGAAMALALSTGAAMAQEGNDAQNLFNGSPTLFNEYAHGDFATRPGAVQLGGGTHGTYSVQSRQFSPAPDGNDGGGN